MYKYMSLFTLCSLIFANPASTKAEDWPTFMRDKYRSGVTSEQLELPLNESWVIQGCTRATARMAGIRKTGFLAPAVQPQYQP